MDRYLVVKPRIQVQYSQPSATFSSCHLSMVCTRLTVFCVTSAYLPFVRSPIHSKAAPSFATPAVLMAYGSLTWLDATLPPCLSPCLFPVYWVIFVLVVLFCLYVLLLFSSSYPRCRHHLRPCRCRQQAFDAGNHTSKKCGVLFGEITSQFEDDQWACQNNCCSNCGESTSPILEICEKNCCVKSIVVCTPCCSFPGCCCFRPTPTPSVEKDPATWQFKRWNLFLFKAVCRGASKRWLARRDRTLNGVFAALLCWQEFKLFSGAGRPLYWLGTLPCLVMSSCSLLGSALVYVQGSSTAFFSKF